MGFGNLPPGVSDGMIPGNRPEDEAWEKFHESVDRDTTHYALDPTDAMRVWKIGVAAWLELKMQEDDMARHVPDEEVEVPSSASASRIAHCKGCGISMAAKHAIWLDYNGKPDALEGSPWCPHCAPEP